MKVSIIIVNYNTFALTCACIESIYQHCNSVEFEIIVVDNASGEVDPTEFVTRFPEVLLVRNKVNRGFAGGNNDGLAVATGDYLLLLNSDTWFTEDSLTPALTYLKRNSEVAALTVRLHYPDGKIQHNCQRFPSIRYTLAEIMRLQKLPFFRSGKLLYGSFFNYNEPAAPDWIWGTYFLMPRHWLLKLKGGRLSEDYFLYVEDMLWCRQFRDLGGKIAFIPDTTVIHAVGQSKGLRNEHMERNLEDFMHRYYSWVHRKAIILFRYILTGTFRYQ